MLSGGRESHTPIPREIGQTCNVTFERTAQILLPKFSTSTSMIAASGSLREDRRGKDSQGLVQQPQFDILTTSNLEEDKHMSLMFL